jgi:hypothetical protein
VGAVGTVADIIHRHLRRVAHEGRREFAHGDERDGRRPAALRENVKGTAGFAGWLSDTTVAVGTVADTGYTVTFNALTPLGSARQTASVTSRRSRSRTARAGRRAR